MSTGDRKGSALLLLFGAAFLVRLLVAIEAGESMLFVEPVGDEAPIHRAAEELFETPEGSLWQAPGASWALGLWYTVADGVFAGRVFHGLLGALTAVLVAALGFRLTSRKLALSAGWLYALWAPGIFFGLQLGKAAGASLALVGALLLATRFRDEARRRDAFLAGLAIGLGALTRESLVALVPVVLLALGKRGAGLGVLGVLLAAMPLVVRNVRAGESPLAYTSNFGTNLWIGNHEEADGLYRSMLAGRGSALHEADDAREIAERVTGESLDGAGVSEFWRGEALHWMGEEPGAAFLLTLRKLQLVTHDTEWMDSVAYPALLEESFTLRFLGYLMHFGWLLPLALIGSWLSRDRTRWVSVSALTVLLAHVPFFIFARFRAPALPLLALLAVIGIAELWRRRSKVGAAITAMLVVLACLPTGIERSDVATSYNNVAAARDEAGRTDEAVAAVVRALEADPDHIDANFNRGQWLAAAGRIAESEPYFQRALKGAPDYEFDARLIAGRAWIAAGNEAQARAELERAAQAGVDSGRRLHQVGLAFRELGDAQRAMQLYQASIEADPLYGDAANDLGVLRWSFGDWQGAVRAFEFALAADPRSTRTLVNLAGLLASSPEEAVRDGERALDLAEQAAEAGASEATVLDLRGMALAELGRFGDAAAAAEEGATRAREAGQPGFASDIERRAALYRSEQAYTSE